MTSNRGLYNLPYLPFEDNSSGEQVLSVTLESSDEWARFSAPVVRHLPTFLPAHY